MKSKGLNFSFVSHLHLSSWSFDSFISLGLGKLETRSPHSSLPDTSALPTPPDLAIAGLGIESAMSAKFRKQEAKRYVRIFQRKIVEKNSHYRGITIGRQFIIRRNDTNESVFVCEFIDVDVKNAYGQFAALGHLVEPFVAWVNDPHNTIPNVFDSPTPE
jgi:hypothetical protein